MSVPGEGERPERAVAATSPDAALQSGPAADAASEPAAEAPRLQTDQDADAVAARALVALAAAWDARAPRPPTAPGATSEASLPFRSAAKSAALRAALAGALGAVIGAGWAWWLRDTFPSVLGPMLLAALLVGLACAGPAAAAGWAERRGWSPGRSALAVLVAGAAAVVGLILDGVYVAGTIRSGAEGGLDAMAHVLEEAGTREGALAMGMIAGLALGHGLVAALVVRRRRLGQRLWTVLGRSLFECLALAAGLLLSTGCLSGLLFQRGPPPGPIGALAGLGMGLGLFPVIPGLVVAPLWTLLFALADRLEARR